MNETDALTSLPGLGPKSAQMLRAAGIRTLAQLRALGAVRAYLAVRTRDRSASLNLLWALEGALTQRSWQEVARQDRLRLLLELEEAQPRPKQASPRRSRRRQVRSARRPPGGTA